jgi:sugar phosphate isomerase/epimerase
MGNWSRRQFLGASGTFFSISCAGAPPETARKTRVGGHPWVYAATRPKNDIYGILDQIFPDMAAAGLDFIELMHTALEPAEAVDRIGDLSARHNLPVIGTSWSAEMWKRAEHERIYEYADRMIGRLSKLGATVIGASVGNAGHVKTEEELDAQAEILRRVTFRAAAYGITLNLHNHTYEVENGEHDLKGTLARAPDAKLGPDLDWLVGAGVDPVGFIRRHGERIVYAHLRDRKSDGVWSEAMGEGSIDYKAIAAALREAGFAGDLAIELAHPKGFQPTRPLRESLRMSREYVRRTMGY